MNKSANVGFDDPAIISKTLADLHTQLSNGDPIVQCAAYDDLVTIANQGSSEAMYLVARCLMSGRGVEPNQEAGHKWLEHAVSVTPPSRAAFHTLGMLHINSIVDSPIPQYGIGLLAKSYELDYPAALTDLLRLCSNSEHQLEAQKATYRALGTLAASPGAGKALEDFRLFCRAFKTTDLLDS
jgi:TPR repeat protein